MPKYPDWVYAHKEKGTCVKKVGNSYYLYHATSHRVPGKKYPQPVHTFIGTITKEGLVRSKVRKVSTETVTVYEYGFSYAMRELLPDKFQNDFHDGQKANMVFLCILRHYSPQSYLLREHCVPDSSELRISLSTQVKKLERLMGFKIQDILPLSCLCLVETKECDMLSKLTPDAEELFRRLGVKPYEL